MLSRDLPINRLQNYSLMLAIGLQDKNFSKIFLQLNTYVYCRRLTLLSEPHTQTSPEIGREMFGE
jgi:hypothetical protein